MNERKVRLCDNSVEPYHFRQWKLPGELLIMIFGVQYDISPKGPFDHDMPTFTLRMAPPWMQI
jgi:hypothetical protein